MSEDKNRVQKTVNSADDSVEVNNESNVISSDTICICVTILIATIIICYFLREISINVLYR